MAELPAPERGSPHLERGAGRAASGDRSRLNWLLLLPLLLLAWPPLFNRADPRLFDIPFFYWYQLAVIPVGVVCTTLVYRAGRSRP